MVTKGIITSIDFNGNTCQVRIPLFETAGNDPITGTAIVSNTPGSYNGYKVGDVVLVAFEDGKMQNPVIVGKLYLGAAKEKQDPRGTINVETTTASKSASLPADAVLTANVDSNVPNTNTPFGSLASIANNLNSLNTDVNQLDRFTRNQFNSVITDVNDQGEQLRSEIKQTASNIEANVVHTHKDGSQDALGWDLTTDSWKINAQDTVNGKVKDINIVTIDRNGMSVAGDLKLSGYPRNITVLYAQTGPNENYPKLYNFTEVEFPVPFPVVGENKDETWYYGKYIKIEENYVLIFKENFEHYKKLIDLGITKAYNREINPEWKTETPARVDGQYIWQWTHTEIYSFDGDKWDEQDDDKVVCITGADGKDGAPGKDGYNTVTVMLYKRSKTPISDNPIDIDLYYKFSDQKLYEDKDCTINYDLPEGWSYTINGAGSSSNGDLYCIAAVARSNADSDSIPASEWVGPTLYVKNGEPTITLSIENDFDSIPCDYDGVPSYSDTDWKTKTSHTIKVLEGQVQQQFSAIADSSNKQIPSTGYAVVYKPDSSITYRIDTTDKTLFTAHIEGLTTDSANVLYTLYKNGKAIDEARFTATKLKAGAPGDPAVDYDILFSSGTIKVSKTGDKTPKTINVNFKKTVGQAEPEDFSGKYKVFIDNGTEPISQGLASSIVLATSEAVSPQIDVSSAKSSVIIELYTADGNTKLEGETIDVVADGTDGTSVAQLILYKRSTEIPSSPADDGTWTYDAAHGTLTCSKKTEWKTGIPSGTAPCYESHAAVLVTGLGTITIEDEKWSEPAKFVENGADGQPGVYIKEVKQWYKLVAKTDNDPIKPTTDIVKSDENGNPTHITNEGWSDIPLDAINDMNLWTSLESIFSDDTSEKRHIEFSDPVKDAAYALAQGKTTNYYSPTEPIHNVKKGDCWFDTGYVNVGAFGTKAEYLSKFVISTAGDILVEQDENDSTRYIQNATGSTKLIKVTPENINTLIKNKTIVVDTTEAFETGNLKQCSGFNEDTKKAIWEDIAGELVTNKLTANYINAMDITSKKIEVLDSNNDTLFLADGIDGNGEVNIGGWKVNKDKLYSGANTKAVSLQSNLDKDSYVDCIIANGKQFIDTGIWLNFNTDSIEITYQPTKNQEGVVFGNGANWERAALCLSGLNNAVNFYIGHVIDQTTEQKTLKTYINTTNLNKQTIKIQKETVTNIKGELENRLVLYVNDIATSYEVCIGEWSRTNWTLYIAAGNNNGGGAYSDFFGKIYGCKIWRNDELIRDYVPYYQASSKKYGLFDNCSKEFKASDSGSEFDGEASSIYVGSEDSSNAPFSISNTGSVRASDVVLKGYIMSDGGNIGGFNITDNTLTAGTFSSNDFIAIASKNALEARVANIKDYYKLIIGPNFGVTKKGDVHIGSGKFTGEISAESGKLSGIESIECLNSLKIGPVELTPVNFMESSIADQTVAFTIETGHAAYIGSSTIYYVTITSSQKLAKAIQLPYRLTYATYLGTYGGTSSYNNKTQNIYFNKVITFPANTTTYEISTIADSYDQYGSWRLVDIQVSQIGAVVDAWDPDHNWFTCKAPVNSTAEAWALKFSQNLVPNSTEAKLSLGVSNQAWDKIYCKSAHAEQFYASSDLRLKENIKEFSPQKSILDLPVVEFDFKDSGKHQIGCIAQDLQKLFPELVETEENGYLTIAENKLVYLLLLEIKKLNAKIENLSTTNKSKGGHK